MYPLYKGDPNLPSTLEEQMKLAVYTFHYYFSLAPDGGEGGVCQRVYVSELPV